MVDQKRLVDSFLEMVQIDSESLKEGKMADYVENKCKALGATSISRDKANEVLDSETGNVYAFFPGFNGGEDLEPVLLSMHLDTVSPGIGVKPVVDGDVIKSDGTTVLGADDKSGIAAAFEALTSLKDDGRPVRPVDMVFTVCEEQGVSGSKHLDFNQIRAKYGYCLDDEPVGGFTVGAPSKATLTFKVKGKESHAGVAPEKGINAIQVAAKALADMKLGLIDPETCANAGVIEGGRAINVVPDSVIVKCEARSSIQSKIDAQIEHMVGCFRKAVSESVIEVDGKKVSAEVEEIVDVAYKAFKLDLDSVPVKKAAEACQRIGVTPDFRQGLGGTDANRFNGNDIAVILVGTGMENVHSKDEYIKISDLVQATSIVKELLAG